ncbi:MAG: oxygenase MpaB family protein [Ilumatobacter sp.]
MTESLRTWLGAQVRTRVVGPDAAQRASELHGTRAPGWFDEDAPIRRVHADASMFIGGLRALLFQSLHPLAMAGVAQHSDYRHDPWGRLQRTADFVAATTFGPAAEAQRAVDVVHRVHTRVVGVAADGREYAANDPHLLRWVHVAELDSFLTAHDRFGERPPRRSRTRRVRGRRGRHRPGPRRRGTTHHRTATARPAAGVPSRAGRDE